MVYAFQGSTFLQLGVYRYFWKGGKTKTTWYMADRQGNGEEVDLVFIWSVPGLNIVGPARQQAEKTQEFYFSFERRLSESLKQAVKFIIGGYTLATAHYQV